MSLPSNEWSGRQLQLHRVLAEYWAAVESGKALDRTEWAARYPEFQSELREFFADWDRMHTLAPLWRQAKTTPQCPDPCRHPATASNTVALASSADTGRMPAVETREFGPYELLLEMGRGGMGVVYKARQQTPSRLVALKMIRAGLLASPVDLRRFSEEADAVARLDHPHIVPIYEVGQQDGYGFYTMKLLEGGSLAQHLPQFAEDPRSAALLLVTVAGAVHHAHCRGILHRDLKPSNVLLDDQGWPYVADFGLARRLELVGELTQTGELVGTPSYMTPEQIGNDKRHVTVATDVYGLGAVLYALLTGSPPAQGDTVLETLRQVQEREPRAPRSTNPGVDRDLEIICLKALKKKPEQRYASAADFADDVQRYLNGQPIEARPANRPERTWLWVRRNPMATALLATVLSVAVLGMAGFYVHNARLSAVNERLDDSLSQSQQDYQHAVTAQRRSERSEAEAGLLLYISDMALAAQAARDGDARQLRDLLVRHRPAPGAPDHRGFEWHYLWRLGQVDQQDIGSQTGAVYFTCYSPDGRWLAVAGQDAVVRLYDARTYREELALATGQIEVNGLAFSPDARLLASAGDDGTLRLWDLATGRQLLSIAAHPKLAYQVLFVPDSDLLISCGNDAIIRLWDRNTGKSLGQLEGHEDMVEAIALSPDAKTLVSVASDQTARLWDLASLSPLRVLTGHRARVVAVAFSPEGRHLATASLDKTVQVWSVATGDLLFTASHVDGFQSVAFSPDGLELAAGDRGGAISLWRTVGQDWSEDVEHLRRWHAHEGRVYDMTFSPDGRRLVSAAQDGVVTVWKRSTVDVRQTVEPEAAVRHMAWVGGRGWLAVTDERSIQVWDVAAGRAVIRFATQQPSLAVAATIDGRQLAAVDAEGRIRLWDLDRRAQQASWDVGQPLQLPCYLAISPDGTLLGLSGHGDNRFWLLDTATGRIHSQFSAVNCFAPVFSPDGRRLAIPSQDDVLMWDVDGGEFMQPLSGHSSTVNAVAYSPDGRYAASVSNDRLVKLWDATAGVELHSLGGHRAEVLSVAFSPDSRSLVSGSNQTLRIWHVGTGRPLYQLDTTEQPIHTLLFSPDGRHLASLTGGPHSALLLYDTGAAAQ